MPALSFEVADGQCIAIEGPSGAGKTRLLRALADLDPSEGQVLLDGAERAEMPAPQWRKAVRYVAAEPAWWTDTPRAAFPASIEHARLARHLSALGLSAELLDRPISSLSTGERQRLALARATIDNPRVLLLDEPTASLDAASAVLVEEMIKFQLLAGRSVVLASHEAGLIARLAHERLLLGKPRTGAASGRGSEA